MVDSTDFATPESALSAATKIKIYGQLRSATGTNFVSSGTGSLTNDITHVGASATGQYQIALAKADLSDASAAWYDHYVITLSATGAAYQTLFADGILTGAQVSNISAQLSDAQSYLAVMSGVLSDTYSLLSDTRSTTDSQFAVISNYLSNISVIVSDAHSAAILGASHASDAYSAALLAQSLISDVDSALTSQYSDVTSKIGAIAVTVTASDISDIASAVQAVLASDLSDIHSAAILAASNASDAYSAALLGQSLISDVDSALTSQYSDLVSKIGAITASVGASDISDIASAVVAALAGSFSDVKSAVIVAQSLISDVDSALTSQYSDVISAIGGITVSITASDISDIASAVAVAVGFTPSGIAAAVWSDYGSQVGATPSAVYTTLAQGASNANSTNSMLSANRSEPGTGAPSASTTALAKLDYLYKAWRNKHTQTTTTYTLFADDGSTEDQAATVSDDGTTFTKGEVGSA